MRVLLFISLLMLLLTPALAGYIAVDNQKINPTYVTIAKSGAADFITTDYASDTIALETAAAYVSNNNLGTLLIKEGTYNIDMFDVPKNVHVQGVGMATKLVKKAGTSNYGIGVGSTAFNVTLSDFEYDGNAVNAPTSDHGIRLDNTNNVEIYNLYVHHTVHHGITDATPSRNIKIHDNHVAWTGFLGTQDGVGIIVKGYNIVVSGNTAEYTAYHAYQAYTGSTDVTIADNTANWCGNNKRVGGTNGAGVKTSITNKRMVVTGNTINNQYEQGILIDQSADVTVVGNTVNNATRGIYINNADYVTCSDNVVSNSRDNGIYAYNSGYINIMGNIVRDSATNYNGIIVGASDSVCIIGNQAFNTAAQTQSYGIRLESTATNCLVTGNILTNNLRGATINLGSTNKITGNFENGLFSSSAQKPMKIVLGSGEGCDINIATYADDAQAIDAALAQVSTGGEIHLREGTYQINSVVDGISDVTISGAGESTVLIANYTVALDFGNDNNVTISDLVIQAQYPTTNSALGIELSSDSNIERVKVIGTYNGMYIFGSRNVIRDCTFENIRYTGIETPSGAAGSLVNYNTVDSCDFKGRGFQTAAIRFRADDAYAKGVGNKVTNNYLSEINIDGIYMLNQEGATVSNTLMEKISGNSLEIDGVIESSFNNINIKQNLSATTGTPDAILLRGGASDNFFNGIFIKDTLGEGIEVMEDSSRNSFQGIYIFNPALNGIEVTESDFNKFSQGEIRDVQSSVACSIRLWNATNTNVDAFHLWNNSRYGFYEGGSSDYTTLQNSIIENATSMKVSIVGNNSIIQNTNGYNPRGIITTPAIPESGTSYLNNKHVQCTVYVAPTNMTAVYIAGLNTSLSSGAFPLASGEDITLYYNGTVSWKWIGN